MAKAEDLNKIDTRTYAILGIIGLGALAIYLFLRGSSTNVNPTQTQANKTTTPQTASSSNATNPIQTTQPIVSTPQGVTENIPNTSIFGSNTLNLSTGIAKGSTIPVLPASETINYYTSEVYAPETINKTENISNTTQITYSPEYTTSYTYSPTNQITNNVNVQGGQTTQTAGSGLLGGSIGASGGSAWGGLFGLGGGSKSANVGQNTPSQIYNLPIDINISQNPIFPTPPSSSSSPSSYSSSSSSTGTTGNALLDKHLKDLQQKLTKFPFNMF